jgi:hypothetical protein
MMLIASSGGAKSELLSSFTHRQIVEHISTLTPTALISGVKSSEEETSLLARLDGKIMIIKDLTTLLTQNKIQRDEIFGILRDAYDQHVTKTFGNGLTKIIQSKFGIMAGCTPVVDRYMEELSALGERFMRCRISYSDEELAVDKAISNAGKETEMREELTRASNGYLAQKIVKNYPIDITEHREQILSLGMFLAIMRSTVYRDKYSYHITSTPIGELGTRFVKQLIQISKGLCYVNNLHVINEYIAGILEELTIASLPINRAKMITPILLGDGNSIKQLIDASKLTDQEFRLTFDEFHAFRIFEYARQKSGGFKAQETKLTQKFENIINKAFPNRGNYEICGKRYS